MKEKTRRQGNESKRSSVEVSFGRFDPASYVFGRTQHFIEVYAAGNGLSAERLAAGVATLLLATASREVLGAEDRMPPLRRTSTEMDQATRTLEMDGEPHSQPPRKMKPGPRHMSAEARQRISDAQKKRWSLYKKGSKRTLTPKQLRAYRKNAKKARAALAASRMAA